MRTALACLALLALVWVGFQPALEAGALSFDDDLALTLNPHVRGLDRGRLEWMATTPHLGHYQPLTWLSYALEWSPEGFDFAALHRTGVLLHWLGAVSFLWLAVLLFARVFPGASGGARLAAAAAAAALFAVHPLRAESVAWLTERRDVLSTPLFLLSLCAWVRGAPERPRRLGPGARWTAVLGSAAALGLFLAGTRLDVERGLLGATPLLALAPLALALAAAPVAAASAERAGGWYLLALAALALSLGCKAWGMVLPGVLLVLDAWPLRRWRRARDLPALVVEKLPFAALALAFAALARWAQASQQGTMRSLAEHTLLERALQAAYGLVWYPLKTLVPTGLSPLHELPDQLRLADPRFWVPALAVLLGTAALVRWRRRVPALAAACAAYALIVSPVLGLAQSGPQLVAGRYAHLACLPFALLAGGGWLALAARAPGSLAARAVPVGLALLVAASTLATRRQVAFWRGDEPLWERALAVDPRSPTAHLQLALVRLEQGRLEEARGLLERGFELRDDPRFLGGLARYWELRAAAEPERAPEHRQQALEAARRALVLALDTDRLLPVQRYNYGTALWNAGRAQEALEHLRWYAEQAPDQVLGRVSLALALTALGRPAEALPHAEAAVALDPSDAGGWRALARARAALGRGPGAAEAWRRVRALLGDDPEASAALAAPDGG